jgi:hypothetical protein
VIDHNLLEKISNDRALGSAMLFAHRHPQESAAMHVEMMDLWRSADEFVLIEAFRDAAKSTIAEEAITMEGCFGNFHYMLLIGETYTKACQRLAAIDYECRTNVKLHRVFGGEVLGRKSIENKVFFKSGAMIEAVGWEQELQSFKQHEHRPDFAWLDDIENQERVRDAAAVQANMRKFWLEFVPAMDKSRRRVRFTQTRRAEDCMVTRFAASAEWLYRGWPICSGDLDDPAARSNWPARYPMEWIRDERDRFQADGMLQEFKQAYLLQVTDPGTKPFKEDMLGARDASPWHWMPKYAIYDPARTSDPKKSDRYGKVVVSRMGSQILVHRSEGAFWKPNEFIDELFTTYEQHAPAKIGIEKNSLDDWLLQPIRLEMIRRGVSLPIVPLQAPQDRSKEDFIMGLQPFAQAGDIVLVGGRAGHPQLVAEWANFPQGPRDIMNALAYSLRMFAGQPVYGDFGGANIGEASTPARGETVYVGFNASSSETVCAALVRDGRRLTVAMDGAGVGPDAVKSLVFELKAAFPLARFSVWVPAEVHDQWQRVALVPQLRAEHVAAARGEHVAPVRGCLADRMRTEWRGKRMLLVDRRARLTLNALSTGYAMAIERGGRIAGEPEQGTSRLVAEAVECVAAILDRELQASSSGMPQGANIGTTPSGVPYVTAHPKR